MSMEDLREHGVLLPEEDWGRYPTDTTVPQGWMATLGVVAVAAIVVMYLGAGGPWTWIALVAFLLANLLVTWICDRAVERQRRRSHRIRDAAAGTGDAGGSRAEADDADSR